MARIPNTGRASSVSAEEFNERVKRLLADKVHEPQPKPRKPARPAGSLQPKKW